MYTCSAFLVLILWSFKDNWVKFIVCCFSGRDQFQPGQEEGERLSHALPTSEIRKFNNSGHFLLLVGLSLSLSLSLSMCVCAHVGACLHVSSSVCGFSCL